MRMLRMEGVQKDMLDDVEQHPARRVHDATWRAPAAATLTS